MPPKWVCTAKGLVNMAWVISMATLDIVAGNWGNSKYTLYTLEEPLCDV